jgi:hypothetical protein
MKVPELGPAAGSGHAAPRAATSGSSDDWQEQSYKCTRSKCTAINQEGSKWSGSSTCEYWVCEKAACDRHLKTWLQTGWPL